MFVFITTKLDTAIHVPENDLGQPVPSKAQWLTHDAKTIYDCAGTNTAGTPLIVNGL
jgi:hypothetical protein